ncbi:MATE family efflux transporter [Trinickia diaoshuihuensis]|uniref:MATE family efflux transporter n=1 Tax=Trinickia diaoshuihuensis TaxID=2292265 RepID=UPI000E25FFD0|nr:MATE family efflux transporter [Trinickia diaoshuihuensis]
MNAKLQRYRDIAKLAAPIAGIQFAQVALTSTDLLMMGFISIKAIAGGGLALLLYNQLRTMCVGMVTATGNLIATAVGQSEKRTGTRSIDALACHEIRGLMRASMLLATGIAVGAGLLLVCLGRSLEWLGQDASIRAVARPVMSMLAPGLIPMLWLNVLRQFSIGMRRAGSLLTITVLSIAVNAILNATFIYGWLGMPRLGAAGIGLSTTLVQTWSLLVYLRIVRADPDLRALLALDGWRAQAATIKRMASMGVPIALTYGSEAALTSIATVFVGTFGPIALAASNIVNQLAYIVYQLNIGLSHGSSILVSRTVGTGQQQDIGAIAKQTLAISFGIMAVIGLVYILIPRAVLRPFLGAHANPALFATATALLWFAVAHQFLKGSQNICVGLLRGLGNTRAGLTSTFIGYWLIGVPAMAIFGYWIDWRAQGVWLGLCIGFFAASLLLWRQFSAELRLTACN